MKIEKNTAVTLRISITEIDGKPTKPSNDDISYLHGGYDNIFAKLEGALDGQEAGFKTSLALSAADAFGERDPALEMTIPKSDFPPGVKVGGQLELPGNDGELGLYYVVKIKGDKVMLDGNHPLSGKSLRLSATVKEVRAATEEEIAHEHVHGAHGHQH